MVTKTYIQAESTQVPVRIHYERRGDVRMSIVRTAAYLRVPERMPKHEFERHWTQFEQWVKDKLAERPELQERFEEKTYQDGDVVTIYSRAYRVRIQMDENRRSHTARLEGNAVLLTLSANDNSLHLQKSIRHLLSRCIGADCLTDFTRRVFELNHLYFRQKINSVNFKYNRSNWGSCSTNRNLNFSTRLLFAPTEVIDYVIIHELAHLVEMNHSDAFWNIVAKAMPNYAEKELWLKRNNRLCDF